MTFTGYAGYNLMSEKAVMQYYCINCIMHWIDLIYSQGLIQYKSKDAVKIIVTKIIYKIGKSIFIYTHIFSYYIWYGLAKL